MLRTKLSKNRFKKNKDNYMTDIDKCNNNDQQLYFKVSRAFTDVAIKPKEQQLIFKTIAQRIQRPNTPHATRRDYNQLKDLLNYNQHMKENEKNNIKRIKTIKSITKDKQKQREIYLPLSIEIKNTEKDLRRKKYQKYSAKKLQAYYQKKINNPYLEEEEIFKQQHIQTQKFVPFQSDIGGIISAILHKGIRNIKNYVTKSQQFKKKLEIFGDDLLLEKGERLIDEAKEFLCEAIANKDNFQLNLIKYTLNHFLLKKLMEQIFKDTKILEIKAKNKSVYQMIKEEMVSQVIDEEYFMNILKEINDYHDKKLAEDQLANKRKHGRRLHPRQHERLKTYESYAFNSSKQRQNDIGKQFDDVYYLTRGKIEQALIDVTNKKKNNYVSVI